MMPLPIINTDQATVLTAVVARLRANLLLNDRTCWISDLPAAADGSPTAGAPYWVTVCAGGGEFPPELQIGGGQNQVTEEASVIVTGYTRIRLDGTAHADKLITDLNRGLLPIKRLILASMLYGDQPLVDDEGNPLLRAYVMATRAEQPAWDQQKGIGWVSVHFATPFDWDLSNVLP